MFLLVKNAFKDLGMALNFLNVLSAGYMLILESLDDVAEYFYGWLIFSYFETLVVSTLFKFLVFVIWSNGSLYPVWGTLVDMFRLYLDLG